MSALRQRLLADLEDYFMDRGKFVGGAEYFGMFASQKSELLIDYLQHLSPEEREELMRLLTDIAVADEELIPAVPGAVPGAVHLLYYLCAKGYLKESSEAAVLLEREFTDPANVEMWIRAGQMTESQGGANFKQTWHYAAALSFILMLLKSERAASTRQYLIEHAGSEEFRKILRKQPQSILFK